MYSSVLSPDNLCCRCFLFSSTIFLSSSSFSLLCYSSSLPLCSFFLLTHFFLAFPASSSLSFTSSSSSFSSSSSSFSFSRHFFLHQYPWWSYYQGIMNFVPYPSFFPLLPFLPSFLSFSCHFFFFPPSTLLSLSTSIHPSFHPSITDWVQSSRSLDWPRMMRRKECGTGLGQVSPWTQLPATHGCFII